MEINQGYIDQVNFDGTIAIRNGPTIRINDPKRRVLSRLLFAVHGGRRQEPQCQLVLRLPHVRASVCQRYALSLFQSPPGPGKQRAT